MRLADTFFNGRKAPIRFSTSVKTPTVTIEALIARKVSTVRVGDKTYRVSVEEVKG